MIGCFVKSDGGIKNPVFCYMYYDSSGGNTSPMSKCFLCVAFVFIIGINNQNKTSLESLPLLFPTPLTIIY